MYYHDKRVITTGNDDTLRIWDVATASITKEIQLEAGLRRCWVHRGAGCIFACSFPKAQALNVLDSRTG